MNKTYLIVLGIFLISFVSAIPLPHAFEGEVTYSNGDFVGVGTIVAMIDESMVGSSYIIQGAYDLIVKSEYGGLIYFYLEDSQEPLANYTFNSFEITELDFVIFLPIPKSKDKDDDEEDEHTSHRPKQHCEPNWNCGTWSSCESGIMKRECYDTNSCSYSYNKPNEITSCEMIGQVFVGKESNSSNVLYFMGVLTLVTLLVSLIVLSKK